MADRLERMRRHREEMELALAEGLTLDEARQRLASYRDHRPRLDAPVAPAAALSGAPSPVLVAPADEDEDRRPWWQRD